MVDDLLDLFLLLYGIGASFTTLALLVVLGPRLIRKLIRALPEMTLEDWLLAPIHGLFALFLGAMGLWGGALLWPATLLLLHRTRRNRKERRLEERVREFDLLLHEVHEAKRGAEQAPEYPPGLEGNEPSQVNKRGAHG